MFIQKNYLKYNYKKLYKFIIASISLSAGCLIYVLWRSETLTMFEWFRFLNMMDFIIFLRNLTQENIINFPDWFIYSLPNALWLFSGILIFDSIWESKCVTVKRLWIMLFLFIAIGYEIGQGINLINGTFDPQDLFLMLLAICSAYQIIILFNKMEGFLSHET